jgi:hypothetical protein
LPNAAASSCHWLGQPGDRSTRTGQPRSRGTAPARR